MVQTQKANESGKMTAAQRLYRVFRRMELSAYAKGWNTWRELVTAERLSSGNSYYQALLEGEQKRRAARMGPKERP